ncbi:MAG TPA: peptidylprolyl isomerase [Hyphomonadaceae bacterium]|nr:peptidylprolyl isomerase [Hyphomonadaceae bacterium]HPN06514.1 peptidylprolyl isomerase [Hyphomonadaceae bacterium]
MKPVRPVNPAAMLSAILTTITGAALALVFSAAAWAQEPIAPPIIPEAPARVGPEVTLHTTMGDILIKLDPTGAPKTAAQFLGLVKSGHYNGAAVYRIEPGFIIQLGDLDANLKYRAPKLPAIPLETATNTHVRGAVALAHAEDPNSGQSTFYIDLADNPSLNATEGAEPNTTGYAVFGHVIKGLDIVDAIAAVELAPEGGPFPGKLPKAPIIITKAAITQE